MQKSGNTVQLQCSFTAGTSTNVYKHHGKLLKTSPETEQMDPQNSSAPFLDCRHNVWTGFP